MEDLEIDIDKLIALERYQAQRETEERIILRLKRLADKYANESPNYMHEDKCAYEAEQGALAAAIEILEGNDY